MLQEFQKRRSLDEEIIEIEDIIMKEYGFIRNEDLKKEPIPRIMNLLKAIEKRYKEEAKAIKRGKK